MGISLTKEYIYSNLCVSRVHKNYDDELEHTITKKNILDILKLVEIYDLKNNLLYFKLRFIMLKMDYRNSLISYYNKPNNITIGVIKDKMIVYNKLCIINTIDKNMNNSLVKINETIDLLCASKIKYMIEMNYDYEKLSNIFIDKSIVFESLYKRNHKINTDITDINKLINNQDIIHDFTLWNNVQLFYYNNHLDIIIQLYQLIENWINKTLEEMEQELFSFL